MSSVRGTVHESLPYIDPEPTPAERAAAEALIAAELAAGPSDAESTPSARLPPLREPRFSPLIEQELARVAASPAAPAPLAAIDTERYQEQDAPASSSPAAWAAPLARAYTASAYLDARHAHLGLLDALGKNVWLTANWQAEGAVLAPLERELADARRRVEVVNAARRRAQDAVAGELRGLEDTWRRGVGRVLETEVAVEALRREVLLARRAQGAAA